MQAPKPVWTFFFSFPFFILLAFNFLLVKPNLKHPVLDHLQPHLDQVRTVLKLHLSPCHLGHVCHPSQVRPLLSDGRVSSPIWDIPRHLMHSNFSVISRLIPGAIVNFAWKEPLVVFYDNILTDQEINLIINKATPRFRKSMVAGKNGEPEEDKSRTSDTAWISSSEDKALASVVQKVVSLTGFSIKNTESIGVNRYRSGQYFNPHYDFLEEQQLSGAPHFRGCQRAGTILIYLSDVEEGGETVFARDGFLDGYFLYDENNPDHLRVKPKRGRVLVWYDMHPYTEAIDLRTLHGGSPVIQGTKMAATIFVRNCSEQLVYSSSTEVKEEL